MKNILFICSANRDRSKTAEDYFSNLYPMNNYESAGTNKKTCNNLGTNYVSQEQLDAADEIYVMENKHLKLIKEVFGSTWHNKITVLDIKDIYKYGSKELIEILQERTHL